MKRAHSLMNTAVYATILTLALTFFIIIPFKDRAFFSFLSPGSNQIYLVIFVICLAGLAVATLRSSLPKRAKMKVLAGLVITAAPRIIVSFFYLDSATITLDAYSFSLLIIPFTIGLMFMLSGIKEYKR